MKGLPSGLQHPFEKVDAPVIKREAYDLLLKVLKPEPAMPAAPPEALPTSVANPWDAIETGSVVLWESDPAEGFFKAEVVGMSKDRKVLTLKWIGYPKLPTFQAKRIAVGLIAVVK